MHVSITNSSRDTPMRAVRKVGFPLARITLRISLPLSLPVDVAYVGVALSVATSLKTNRKRFEYVSQYLYSLWYNMLFFVRVLVFLAMFRDRAFAFAFDWSFVRLVDDATTVLFPPVRISAYLCRLDQENAIALSRIMSRMGLAHEIHRELEDFEGRIHDTWEHRVLYVLDLDCDYAIPLLRAANASGMFMAPIRWLLLVAATPTLGDNSTGEIEATFKDMAVYPDSEVILARKSHGDTEGFTEIESVYRPSPYHGVIVENRGNWTADRGVRMANLDATSRRRRNLRQTPLKSCLVMTDPDTINHLTDYENKHIDPTTKANYPWMLHITSRMNATISFRVTNNWGYRSENGSWNGLTGMLQRREIDIGGTGSFFISQRIGVVDFVQLYTQTSTCFVFRQPLLSTVSNIFTLPFQRSVWMAIGVFLLVVLALLYFSSKWEYRQGSNDRYWQQFNLAEQTLSDNFMVVLGAVAQQGYSYEPYRVPSRIVTLMLLIAALNLYASYTANIVALLQSTTDSINTLADLLHSPLKLGAQDAVYFRYYFKNFQDPIRKAIVEEKIEPKGMNDSYMSTEEGVRRIRDELFAFYGERGPVYKMMQETYQEEEKCGIMEIDMLNVLYPTLVIQVRSPYLEIVKNAALLLRETGLKFRDEYRLLTKKPKCHGQTSFIRIGFTECYFALVSMGYGTLLSLVVLLAELLWYNNCKSIDFRTTTQFVSCVLPFPSEMLEKNVAASNNANLQEQMEKTNRFSSDAMENRLANVDYD